MSVGGSSFLTTKQDPPISIKRTFFVVRNDDAPILTKQEPRLHIKSKSFVVRNDDAPNADSRND